MSEAKKLILADILLLAALAAAFYFSGMAERFMPQKGDPGAAARAIASPLADISGVDIPLRSKELDEWYLLLVNPWNKIPEGFEVKTASVEDGYEADERVTAELADMLSDCREAGCSPKIISAFRQHSTQQAIFDREAAPYINKGMSKDEAYKEAAKSVAVPGTSEHECGLALDIVDAGSLGWKDPLVDAQQDTDTQKWLMEHCSDYGFILRYPKDKEDVTGIIYEPWHYRYVGKEHAKAISEKGLCLEEYIEELS